MPTGPTPTTPRPRRWRWLRRIVVTLLVLFALGVAGFTWFAYWPLEGAAASVEALVPDSVDFVYRVSWRGLRDNGWLERNLVDDPIHPGLAPDRLDLGGTTLRQGLDQVRAVEDRINESIPAALHTLSGLAFGSKDFRIERDLLRGDVVAAGRWCGGGSPQQGVPRWREILLLTRVSSQVKFAFEAVRHDFVRDRVEVDPSVRLGVSPLGHLTVSLDDPSLRGGGKVETCEGGYVMGALDQWHVARVRDVIAMSNSPDLIQAVQDLGRGIGPRAVDRPGFHLDHADEGVAVAIDLAGLRSYLTRFLEKTETSTSRVGPFLGNFLAVDSLDRLNASIVPNPDASGGVVATADITYSSERLREFRAVDETYRIARKRWKDEGIARLVPEKDTALVAHLSTPPRNLLRAVYGSLSPEDQRLVEDNVRSIGIDRRARGETGYESVNQFLDELASRLWSTTGVAVARISSVFDSVKYAKWYSDADPAPMATVAILLSIPPDANQEEVDAFLSDRVAAMGFDPPERVTSPGGVPYSRLTLKVQVRDYENVRPAFAVARGNLILSTREDYLLAILETMKGTTRPIADSPLFAAATRALPPDPTIGVFVHRANLRDLLWDYRNEWVHQAHDDAQYARDVRLRIHRRLATTGTPVDLAKVNAEVDQELARFREHDYETFVEEYRGKLDAWSRVGAAAFVLAADPANSRLHGGATLVLQER